MNIQGNDSDNLIAYTTAGAAIPPDRNNATVANRGVTLAAGTYFIPLDSVDDSLLHVTMRWNGAFAATITVESTDFPKSGRADAADVTDWSVNPGDWAQENPTTAYVSYTGAGNTGTNLTITAGGTNAGGAAFHYGNMGARRVRLRLVVTVAGIIRVANNGKRSAI